MEQIRFERIGETMFHQVLDNGLNVFVFPKPEFQKKYAFFATNYGGMDLRFQLDGTWHDTPAGVAHYLEHKMFDTREGNALQQLTANGASPNAFTSNAITGYYFESTEHFEENLRTLLSFVSVPYFTRESVEKERGIIGQEIGMIEDDPNWTVFVNLLGALYEHHPIRTSVAGTVESISHITEETLYACHKAFYDPANMVLCAAGDLDPQAVCRLAREVLPAPAPSQKRTTVRRSPPGRPGAWWRSAWRCPALSSSWAARGTPRCGERPDCGRNCWAIWPARSCWAPPLLCTPGCTGRGW